MPIKYSKDASAKLFRYVKKVEISFNPFDARTKSAREMWRQMQATRFHKANPNLEVKTHVLSTAAPPSVAFTFIDDSQTVFDSQLYDVDEMLLDVHLNLDQMDNEYEMSGKSLDD